MRLTVPYYPGLNGFPEILSKNFYSDENGNTQMAPGLPFAFGSQRDIRATAAKNRWLTTDSTFNTALMQTYTENITGRATIEPANGFRIELNANRNYARSSSEIPRATIGGDYDAFSRIETGNFSMSFISINTAFVKDRKDYSSAVFDEFSSNRQIISLRLAQANGLSNGLDQFGFADGYGPTSQEVLTYSFIAAYSGKSADKIKLNSFPSIPKLNWRVTYDGLSKLKFAKKLFNSVNLHGYRSSYGISSFNSSLLFRQDGSRT